MAKQSITSAVISTDQKLRDTVRDAVGIADGVTLALEIDVPYKDIGDIQLHKLKQVNPELIFLDTEPDADVAFRFAQYLAEQNPGRRIIAAGEVLAPEMLIAGMRAGVTEYLPKPVKSAELGEAIARVQRKLGFVPDLSEEEPGKLYAVFSPKGGSGSTTVATNLAVQLHQHTGKKTLLLDLDLELGEAAVYLGVQPRFNFVDLIRNFHRMDAELLASYIENHDSGVHLLSAPFQPEKAETVTAEQIRRVLVFLRKHYEYLVLDTPKTFTAPVLAALEQTDTIFILTTADLPSLRNIKRCLPMLGKITGNHSDRVRLVVNRQGANDEITLADVERTLGLPVYGTLANDFEAVMRSINTGEPIVLSGNSRFSRDMQQLSGKITGIETQEQRGGLFARVQPLTAAFRRLGSGGSSRTSAPEPAPNT